MKPSLRKRHRNMWLILAILMPVLFLLSVLVIPEKAVEKTPFPEIAVDKSE